MTKTRKTIIEIINVLTHMGFIYGLAAPVAFLLSANAVLLPGLILAAACANFFMRRVNNRMIVSVAVHMALPIAAFIFLPFTVINVLWIGLFILLATHSLWIQFRKHTDGTGFAPFCIGAFIAILIWASLAGNTDFISIYPPLVLFIVAARFMLFRMQQADRSLEAILNTSQKVKESNLRSILSFDYKLTAGLFIFLLALSALVYFTLLSPVIGALQGLAPSLPTIDVSPTGSEYYHLGTRSLTPPEFPMEDNPPSRLSIVVIMVLTILLGGMFGVAVLWLLYIISRWLLRFLSRRKTPLADAGELPDEKEFIAPISARSKQAKMQAMQEHPIRKIFRETIVRHKKMGVPIKPTDTPSDMAKRIHSEDITTLTEEYRNVRYKN